MKKRFRLIIDVHLFLLKDDKILLIKRANTGYMDGYYHVPAGHLEGNERLIDALIRETKEEVGIEIKEEDVHLVHLMHNKSDTERLALFFEAQKWRGKVKNMEPQKHSEIGWFKLNRLPKKTVPYAKEAIKNYRQGTIFSHFGWR